MNGFDPSVVVQNFLEDALKRHPTQPLRLWNVKCVYCGSEFSADLRPTKEHVVGRRFVPSGCLQQSWNLILNACEACNNSKANLEDDLSVITIFPGPGERATAASAQEALRKAKKSNSRRTGKLVLESQETMNIVVPFGSARMTFHLISPPQADDDRVEELCLRQLIAFFYMLTYAPDTKTGRYWIGHFSMAGTERRSNWGNPKYRGFAKMVKPWLYRLIATLADGNFRVMIRRQAEDVNLWAWALEWNKCLRNIGFFGEEALIRDALAKLPRVPMQTLINKPDHIVRIRADDALPEADDTLFDIDIAEAA